MAAGARRTWWRRTAALNAGVLAGYGAISFAYFGWPLLPHPGRDLVGNGAQLDPELFEWSFAWWPHALTSWTNPFVTHVIYAPQGINLTWTTSVPALAYLYWPLTALFGPAVAFNVAALTLPAISGWAAFLLCRALTRSLWASLIGGYLYGFSSYILGHQLAGHINLTAVFVPPLVALVLLRFARGELTRRGLAWRLGLLLALQLYISTELALTLTLVLLLGLALAALVMPRERRPLHSALAPIAGAYALAAVLAAPLIGYALSGFVPGGVDPYEFSADLLNLAIPTHVVAAGGSWLHSLSHRFPGNDDEQGSYLGLPTLIVIVLYAWPRRRLGEARFLVGGLLVTVVLAIGTGLFVDGHRLAPFPWAVAARIPVLDNVLPERFAVYAALAAAVIVARWIATTPGRAWRRPVVLPALAVAALVPTLWHEEYRQHPSRPAFFAAGEYRTCIPRGSTLLIFPFGRWGDSMVWQAESGFWFKMAEGDMGRDDLPKAFVADPVANLLTTQYYDAAHPKPPPSTPALLTFASSHGVDRVLKLDGQPYPTMAQLERFGRPQRIGGATVAPACS